MALKQVELVRTRIARGFAGELMRLRIWLSGLAGNSEAVEVLRGEPGELVLARLTDALLEELGHEVNVSSDATMSKTRRAMRGMAGIVSPEPLKRGRPKKIQPSEPDALEAG